MKKITLTKNDTIFLSILFILSFCIRAGVYHGYLSNNENYWQVDSATYHRVAQGIADGKGISLPTSEPNFYRLPGYPLFIGFLYKIMGPHPQKVLGAQVSLGSLIPILIFFLSLVLFPGSFFLARCASLYSAFHLGLVLYSGFFMTETLFLIFFLLFSIFFFRYVHLWFCQQRDGFAPSNAAVFRGMFFAGIFLGIASMIRPVGHYLVVLSLVLLALSNDTWRDKIKKAATFFVPWLLVVTPWLLRNYLLLGHVFFHTLPGGHFLYLSAARVAMYANDTTYQEARGRLGQEVTQLIQEKELVSGYTLNEIERCYAHEQVAKKYFLAYPLISLKVWITDMLRTCLSLYSAELLYLNSGRKEIDYFSQGRSVWSVFSRYIFPNTDSITLKFVVWFEIIFFLVILLGFLGGLVSLLFGCTSLAVACSWTKVLPYMALFIVIALAGGYARMRLPIEPFLIIFALHFYCGKKPSKQLR